MDRKRSGRSSSLAAWCAAAISLGLLVASVSLLLFEARPYFTSGLQLEQKLSAISGGELEPGLSYNSQALVLDDCRQVLSSVQVQLMAAADRAPIADRCALVARAVTDRAPLDSYAWYVQALAVASTGREEEIADSLVASQRSAPWEAWLAGLRIQLAAKYFDRLPEAAQAAYRADLTAAASSGRSLQDVVIIYRTYPAQREMITAAVERLPPQMQSGFVGQLRSTTRRAP